jgi:signal transduction histidine kinase
MNTAIPDSTARPPDRPSRQIKLTRSWRYHCPVAVRYALAVTLVVAAWAITFALRRSVEAPSFQTPFFICAIVLSSWIGGFRPGVVTTLLSIFTVEFFFTEPRYTLGFTLSEIPKFTVFFLTGGFISWLAGRQRRDEEALLVARESLEEKVRERTEDLLTTNERLTAEVAERIRAEEELHRLNRAWRVRSLFNRSVARSSDEHELLRRVCQSIVRAGGYQLAWIAYPKNGLVLPEAHASVADFEELEPAWAQDGSGHGLAARAIQTEEPTACTLRDRSPELPRDEWAEKHHIKAVIALPLISDGSAIGSLLVYSEEWDAFDEKESDLLLQAADDVAQGIALFRTRTARAVAEQALERTQSELERVARVTTMGELTASIAHEINQPLAALVTNANACMRWLDREPPNLDEAREAARRIIRDGKRGSEVIVRIRALLKKEDAVRGWISINEVIDEILALARNEMAGVDLHLAFAPDLPAILADRVQLQQVLLNLILNASDAMDAVSDRPKSLHIRTSRNGDESIEVAVRDAGTGLPPERLDKVFETFFTTKPNGLGMGLSICRSIIEQHGGRLWATANEDHGATFRFTIPHGT